ncbi:MAG TPA: hypothetical protein VG326_12745 [Tepidisphaeraceae bacterium]|jgi:hypothetical protein|nr:hypothetical protein [Tepidisphaeraceae bacterium]
MLSEIYSETFEDQATQLAYERRERQAHRVPPAPSPKDIEQDSRLRGLERENRKLQCYLSALVEIMRNAGMIGDEQIRAIANGAEWAKKSLPAADRHHA